MAASWRRSRRRSSASTGLLSARRAVAHVGETVIRFATDATITPGEARKLAEALVELDDYAGGPAVTADATLLGDDLVVCSPSPR
jgi:hypothetical protein